MWLWSASRVWTGTTICGLVMSLLSMIGFGNEIFDTGTLFTANADSGQ